MLLRKTWRDYRIFPPLERVVGSYLKLLVDSPQLRDFLLEVASKFYFPWTSLSRIIIIFDSNGLLVFIYSTLNALPSALRTKYAIGLVYPRPCLVITPNMEPNIPRNIDRPNSQVRISRQQYDYM